VRRQGRTRTKQPWAPVPADMALFSNSVVPVNYGGKPASEFAEHPVGTGPFKFHSWAKGQDLKLVKNPNYWQSGKPYLNSVDFRVVASGNTRALQVQGRQAQSARRSPTCTYGVRSPTPSTGRRWSRTFSTATAPWRTPI
jgi:ABC-type transport system substrate-binding protein